MRQSAAWPTRNSDSGGLAQGSPRFALIGVFEDNRLKISFTTALWASLAALFLWNNRPGPNRFSGPFFSDFAL
jgi:hypothetical protein